MIGWRNGTTGILELLMEQFSGSAWSSHGHILISSSYCIPTIAHCPPSPFTCRRILSTIIDYPPSPSPSLSSQCHPQVTRPDVSLLQLFSASTTPPGIPSAPTHRPRRGHLSSPSSLARNPRAHPAAALQVEKS